jgi:hypothetical protein
MNCPGSVKLSENIPNVSSAFAEEGTRAHEIAANMLLGMPIPEDTDPEMRAALHVYESAVMAGYHEGCTLAVEVRFDLSEVYPGLFGTADAVVYHPGQKLLRVVDLKYGAGIAVEVMEEGEANVQLQYYALGALLSKDIRGKAVDNVELVIVQPRCPHPDGVVRSFIFPALDLTSFAIDVSKAAMRTEDENAELIPGDWCRFCPASGICPKLHERALTVAKEEFRRELSYDPKKLSETLNWLPVLEGWIKGVKAFAYNEAEHGRCPPGWKLVAKRANRKWKDPDATIAALRAEYAPLVRDCFTTPELLSPAQVEKVLPKGSKEFLSTLVVAESSGLTLAPEEDKRPAARLDAKSEFLGLVSQTD